MSSSSSSNHKAISFNPIRKSESQFKRTGDVLTKTVVRSLDGNDEEICDFEWSEDDDDISNWL